MADFSIVYGAALAATKELYPTVTEDAQRQLIQTAWHPLKLSTGAVDDSQTSVTAGTQNAFGTRSGQRTRYFVRFRVYVLGGQPFRIRIEGEASQWEQGEVPTPLRGAAIPPWLEGRTDTLRVAIHKRLKEYAVKLTSTAKVEKKRAEIPLKDVSTFGEIPPPAAKLIALVSQAVEGRDLNGLRGLISADIEWAKGSHGADAALAIWAADSTTLAALGRAVDAGCAQAEKDVICPAAPGQGPTAHFRESSEHPGQWQLISFY